MNHDDQARRAALRIAQIKFRQKMKHETNDQIPVVSVESSEGFFSLLTAVLEKDTAENIQKCQFWIVKNVAPSRTRLAALGEYLVSVARSIDVDRERRSAKATRNRIDLLLVVNDVLHADRHHGNNARKGLCSTELRPHIEELVELAASAIFTPGAESEKQLRAVLNFWAANDLVDTEDLAFFQEKASDCLIIAQGGTPPQKRVYTVPEYVGARGARWFELPSVCMANYLLTPSERPVCSLGVRNKYIGKKRPKNSTRRLLDRFFQNIDVKRVQSGENPKGETDTHKLRWNGVGHLVKRTKQEKKNEVNSSAYGWSPIMSFGLVTQHIPAHFKVSREVVEAQETEREKIARERHDAGYPHKRPCSRRWPFLSSNSEYDRYSRPGSRSSYVSRGRSRSPYSRDRSRSPYSRDRSRSPYRRDRSRSPYYDNRSRDRYRDQRPSSSRDHRRNYHNDRDRYGNRGRSSGYGQDRHSNQSRRPFDSSLYGGDGNRGNYRGRGNYGNNYQSSSPLNAPAHYSGPPFLPSASMGSQFHQLPVPSSMSQHPYSPLAPAPGMPGNNDQFPSPYASTGGYMNNNNGNQHGSYNSTGGHANNNYGNNQYGSYNNTDGHAGQHRGGFQYNPGRGYSGAGRGGYNQGNYRGSYRGNQRGRSSGSRWN